MYKVSKTYKNLRFSRIFLTFLVSGLFITSIIFIVGFLNFKISSSVNDWEGKVYRGVSINNIDVSGLSKTSLKEFLTNNFPNTLEQGSVKFTLGDKFVTVPYNKMGLTYDYDKAINEAFEFSSNFTHREKIKQIYNSEKRLDIFLTNKFQVDSNNIQELYDYLSSEFNVPPVDAKVSLIDGQAVFTESKVGYEVDKESLIKMINNTSPESASQNGINLKTKSVDPKVTSIDLSKINGKLSSYTTTFKSSSNERATNVELSANAINGTILMPGESFSFNKIVGPRTKERGYKDAAIIVGNVYESGLGGGICQTSTTLHQAVIRAGIIPTQRRNHSLPTSYVPLGFDAVVAWGSLDYVFKNPYKFPILIDVSTEGRTLTISIYGDVTAVDKSYSLSTEDHQSVPFSTKKINDNTLPKGKEVVEKNGSNGTKLKVYLIIKDKYTGKILEKKFMWNDYYVPQDKIIKVGTR